MNAAIVQPPLPDPDDALIGETFHDRNSWRQGRQLLILERRTTRTDVYGSHAYRAAIIAHPANPTRVGRHVTIRTRTLITRYRKGTTMPRTEQTA